KAKPAYEAGLIQSPEDLRKLVGAGFDAVLAGLTGLANKVAQVPQPATPPFAPPAPNQASQPVVSPAPQQIAPGAPQPPPLNFPPQPAQAGVQGGPVTVTGGPVTVTGSPVLSSAA